MLEQWVPRSPNEMFEFFADAKNLELLTPPYLKFKILRLSTAKIEKGTRLDYRLQLHGIRFKWQSLITEWQAGHQVFRQTDQRPVCFLGAHA